MKRTRILIGGALAALLTAGLQAYAGNDPTFTTGNITVGTGYHYGGAELVPNGYTGSISDSILLNEAAPGNAYNGGGYTDVAYSGTLEVTIWNAAGCAITVKVGGDASLPTTLTPSTDNNTPLTFNLTPAELAYIDNHNPISFTVTGSCVLEDYDLTVNASQSSSRVPDGGSTLILLGGVLTGLALIKRKMG